MLTITFHETKRHYGTEVIASSPNGAVMWRKSLRVSLHWMSFANYFSRAIDALNEGRSIDELELTVRSYNRLGESGLLTVEQVTAQTEDTLLEIKNLGRKSVENIKEALASKGLRLADSGPRLRG